MARPRTAKMLDLRMLAGAAAHEPTELVVTAPAGMRVDALEAQLAEHGQCLPFEPPHFSAGSTVGGMVAAGLSGPARARSGSLRDHLLGVALLSGSGELMHFGGRVIKNVAGYDVSRVVAGSLGILGVIVEVSLKVLPRAEGEATLRFDMKPAEALAALHAWGAKPLPLDASAWWNGNLVVRLRGAPAAVHEAARAARWRDRSTAPPQARSGARCATNRPVLRCRRRSHRASGRGALAPLAAGDGAAARAGRRRADRVARCAALAGARRCRRRWCAMRRRQSAATPRSFAAATSRPASSRRSRRRCVSIHERLKRAFDPNGILNPGRLYPGL